MKILFVTGNGGQGLTLYPIFERHALGSLIRDWKLRRIFWKASREAGDEFAVPVRPVRVLDGGAAAPIELEEVEQ